MTQFFYILLVFLTALLFWMRRREARFLRKRTREALSPELREEIEAERQSNVEKRQKFQEAMKRVEK